MKGCIAALCAPIAALGLASAAGFAQDAKTLLPRPTVAQSNWSQTVSKEPAVAGTAFDKKQLEVIQQVNLYFNQMTGLKGVFVQTGADNKRQKGKFYVKKPGRFRFDYALPSKLVIVSDGEYLAIQDLDMKTDDRVALDQTTFRVLLRKDVDLLRDAQILDVQDVDDVIVLALQDKSPETPGKIKLFLAKKPTLELREWITTDSQGLDTRMELNEVTRVEDIDPALFRPAPVALQKVQ
jgi:outer membrane lipoprotein-sorting protein